MTMADGSVAARDTGLRVGPETPDVETSSDSYARRFAGRAGAYMLAIQEQAIRAVLPPPGGRLLDVGGGHAQLAGPLARLGWRVTVAGSSAECQARLKRMAEPVGFISGDLTALPPADRAFEVVLSVRLISHMEDWRGLVAELCRLADRSVVIDYPTLASPNLLALATFPLKRAIEKNTRTYRSFWPAEIEREFARHGFHKVAVRRQFVFPMGLHRLFKGAAPMRLAEEALRAVGVTGLVGNPVIARFDRRG